MIEDYLELNRMVDHTWVRHLSSDALACENFWIWNILKKIWFNPLPWSESLTFGNRAQQLHLRKRWPIFIATRSWTLLWLRWLSKQVMCFCSTFPIELDFFDDFCKCIFCCVNVAWTFLGQLIKSCWQKWKYFCWFQSVVRFIWFFSYSLSYN